MTEIGAWHRRYGPPLLPAEAPSSPAAGALRQVPVALVHGVSLLLLIGLLAVLAAAAAPQALGYPTLIVRGGSMGDAVPAGSLAVSRWTAAEDVRTGDVIVVAGAAGASPKLHRVTEVQNEDGRLLVRTKGDANAAADPDAHPLGERVAVVFLTIPNAGYVAGFVRTPAGWALLVALPVLLLGAFSLRDIWRSEA